VRSSPPAERCVGPTTTNTSLLLRKTRPGSLTSPHPVQINLPPLAWRMRPDAGYALLDLDPDTDAAAGAFAGRAGAARVHFCALPQEHAVLVAYAAAAAASAGVLAAALLGRPRGADALRALKER
jgi:hypothetical protein